MQLLFYRNIQKVLNSENQLEFLQLEKNNIGIYRRNDEKQLSNSRMVFFKILNIKNNLLLTLAPVPGPLFEKDIKYILDSIVNINQKGF